MKKRKTSRELLREKKSSRNKKIRNILIVTFIVLYCLSFLWGLYKPIPEGVSIESDMYYISDSDITFLADITHKNTTTQEIYASVFDIIDSANEYIILDMFLFGNSNESKYIPLTTQLTDSLINKKKSDPSIPIYFVTDHFNTFYGSYKTPEITQLEENNITVIFTNMNVMRDSNALYSALWRLVAQPFGMPSFEGGFIPNPLGEDSVTLRSALALVNFKANHRKLILNENEVLITSANPHTASSLHSNVAISVRNKEILSDIIAGEQAIANFSDASIVVPTKQSVVPQEVLNNTIGIKYITEGKIKDSVVAEIKSATAKDTIKIGMFYFSERSIISELKKAAKRGVSIELILDANKDAFGREKNGIPNRPVAYELEQFGAKILWYDTHGEQFHTKIFIKENDEYTVVILGSANYTKRNIGDYNFEANIYVISPSQSTFANDVRSYWDVISEYTLAYEEFEDTSFIKYLVYRFQEKTGLSTF